jgi:ligand-binding sensor domain-containing protein
MGTPDDTSDDVFGAFTSGSYPNLLSNEHPAIANDAEQDMMWIGTSQGVAIIPYPQLVLQGADPVIASVNTVSGQYINDIFIDAQNLKWIATRGSGVWVLSGTGDEVVAHINMDNSPLTTNDVNSVFVDERTGDVFFGTTEGLFQAQSLSVKPSDSFDITCYPQPFKVQKHNELIIDGLSSMADINIMTVDGMTVRSLNSNSKVVVWDGRDENGNFVSPGIYIISAKSSDSEKTGVGKIAVTR